MIQLVADMVVAFLHWSDRAATQLETWFRASPTAAEPVSPGERGVPPAAATGGLSHDDFAEPVGEYPDLPAAQFDPGGYSGRSIADTLDAAVAQLGWPYIGRIPAVVRTTQAELRDLAAQFRADEHTN